MGKRASDGGFEIVEFANAAKRFLGDRRQAAAGKIEIFAPGEARCFNDRRGLANFLFGS